MQELLEEIGLTKGEISVYFALLELGSSSVGPIVDKAKVSSSKIYDITQRLIDKGLVSYVIKENTKYFEAASPNRILDYLNEKEKRISQNKTAVKQILPQLLLKQKLSEKKQEVNIYEGISGIKTAHEKTLQTLKKGEEFYFMGASVLSSEKFKDYWMDYHKRRQKTGIGAKILFNDTVNPSEIDKRNSYQRCEAKYLPYDVSTPSWIETFKDTTILGVPSDNPIALEIKNKEVAKSFQSYFNAIWNQRARTIEGAQNVIKFFWSILDDLESGEEYYVFNANHGFVQSKEIKEFFPVYHAKRREKGIGVKMLLNRNLSYYPDLIKLPEQDYKFLSADFKSPLQVVFYKQRLFIVLWQSEVFGVEIQDRKVVSAFKGYFDALWNHQTQTAQGDEAIEDLCASVLADKSDLFLIGANAAIAKQDFFSDWDKKRAEAGIKRFHLSTEQTRTSSFNHLPQTTVRFLPKEFHSPMVIWVFGTKVAHVLWSTKTVFMVDNEQIAKDYRKYFDLLWKTASS